MIAHQYVFSLQAIWVAAVNSQKKYAPYVPRFVKHVLQNAKNIQIWNIVSYAPKRVADVQKPAGKCRNSIPQAVNRNNIDK